MSYSKKYTYNNPPIVSINDEVFLNISIYVHIYTPCVYLQNQHTNIAVLHWLFHFSVKNTRFKVWRSGTKVTAEDKGLAWCTFLCEGPSLLDSDSQQHTAYCRDRSHSSCHRSWHIPDHRYHTRHRAYTGWLKKRRWRRWDVGKPLEPP